MNFSNKLLSWYSLNGRVLPWREIEDAYIIWLSEVILQQTQVKQGLPYFERFRKKYPSIKDFAEASIDAILRDWQGLGYYSRARNMSKAAKIVLEVHRGIFPKDYHTLLTLPGIGKYTAAAISSFTTGEKRAVVDGNVNRVLSRVFGVDLPPLSSAGKKYFENLANQLIDPRQPGTYNQAIMDFGALQCVPKSPICQDCIFISECVAYNTHSVDSLPSKPKKTQKKNRYFNYLILEKDDQIMLSKREQKDIWAELFEFPLIETDEPLSAAELTKNDEYNRYFGGTVSVLNKVSEKHVLSHQNIYARFYLLPINTILTEKKENWEYYYWNKIDKLAKHKLIFSFIKSYFFKKEIV